MRDLLNYPTTIYDANCLVYYIFRVSEKSASGKPVVIEGPDTPRALQITKELLMHNKTVATLRVAWQEAEKVTIASALRNVLSSDSVRARLEIVGKATGMLEYRWAISLRAQLAQLRKERWFVVDFQFTPSAAKVATLKAAYSGFCADPEKQKKIPPYKGDPSSVDLALVIYSAERMLPLLTNDRELYNFSEELKEMKLCELIKGFPNVRLGRGD